MRWLRPWSALRFCLAAGMLCVALQIAGATLPLRPPVAPVRWSVEDPPAPVHGGEEVLVRVRAAISPGWHLYSMEEPDDGPAATTFQVPEAGPARMLEVEASRPFRARDTAFAQDVSFYLREARFALKLRMGTNASASDGSLPVSVRYQACDAHRCLPPRTEPLLIHFRLQGKAIGRSLEGAG